MLAVAGVGKLRLRLLFLSCGVVAGEGPLGNLSLDLTRGAEAVR